LEQYVAGYYSHGVAPILHGHFLRVHLAGDFDLLQEECHGV
jgi:hypothetical protein